MAVWIIFVILLSMFFYLRVIYYVLMILILIMIVVVFRVASGVISNLFGVVLGFVYVGAVIIFIGYVCAVIPNVNTKGIIRRFFSVNSF